MSRRLALAGSLSLVALALAACETTRTMRDDAALPRPLNWGNAPGPYTIDQLRDGCRPGRSSTYHMAIAGRPEYFEVTRYVEADDVQVFIESRRLAASGAALGNPVRARTTWNDMQRRGWYPEEWTRVSDERAQTPAGTFDCRVYEVTSHGDTVDRYWFAKDLPGPPVLHRRHVAGELQLTMTLVEHTPAP